MWQSKKKTTNQSYILSDEFVVLVYDAPRSNANCDDVVSRLNDGVTQCIADVLHNAYVITQYLIVSTLSYFISDISVSVFSFAIFQFKYELSVFLFPSQLQAFIRFICQMQNSTKWLLTLRPT